MDDIKSLVTRFYDTWNTHDRDGHCPKVSGVMGSGVWFPGPGHGLAACRSRRRDGMRWSLK